MSTQAIPDTATLVAAQVQSGQLDPAAVNSAALDRISRERRDRHQHRQHRLLTVAHRNLGRREPQITLDCPSRRTLQTILFFSRRDFAFGA